MSVWELKVMKTNTQLQIRKKKILSNLASLLISSREKKASLKIKDRWLFESFNFHHKFLFPINVWARALITPHTPSLYVRIKR